MNYQFEVENEFGRVENIPIERNSDDLALQEAQRIVTERNNGSVAVKRVALHRLEHVWSASYKTDADY